VAAEQGTKLSYRTKTVKKFLLLLAILSSPVWASSFGYYRQITIAHGMVSGGSSLTNHTVCFQLSNADFKSVENGGKIGASVVFNGATVPADLTFSPNSSGTSSYSFELAAWDATNGKVNACVLNPNLSNSSDWIFYILYGNPGITSYQGGSVGAAWDSYYAAVFHLGGISSLSIVDSTSNGNVVTNSGGVSLTTGLNGGAASFVAASSQYLAGSAGGSLNITGTAITIEALENITSGSSEIVAKWDPAWQYMFGGNPTGMITGNESVGVDSLAGATTLTAATWYHIAGVQQNCATYVYVNGTQDGSNGSCENLVSTSSLLSIGARPGSGYLNGKLQEVRISNTNRSAAWIATTSNELLSMGSYLTVGSQQVGTSPVVGSISPASTAAGGAQFTLTVNGTAFSADATVYWNATALATTYIGSTQLTATVTADLIASGGTAGITVQETAGTSSPAVTFTIVGPAITSFSPTSASAGGAQFTLTVNGTSFVSGDVVKWGSTSLTTSYVGTTQLTAVVTAGLIASPTTASITVTGSTGASAASNFSVYAPTLSSISPTTASAGGSQFTLTVNGANFVPGATVYWDATSLSTTYVGSTQLTATVTSGLITSYGMHTITVQDSGGTTSGLTIAVGPSGPTMLMTSTQIAAMKSRAASNSAAWQAFRNPGGGAHGCDWAVQYTPGTPDGLPPIYAAMEAGPDGRGNGLGGYMWVGSNTDYFEGGDAYTMAYNVGVCYLTLKDGDVTPSGWSYTWNGVSLTPQQYGILAGMQAVKLLNKFTPPFAWFTPASPPTDWHGLTSRPVGGLGIGPANRNNTWNFNIWGSVDSYAPLSLTSAQTNSGSAVLYFSGTSGSASNTDNFTVGDYAVGTNIPAGTKVQSKVAGVSVTLDHNVIGNVLSGAAITDVAVTSCPVGQGQLFAGIALGQDLASHSALTFTGIVGPLATALNGVTVYVDADRSADYYGFPLDSDAAGTPFCIVPNQGVTYNNGSPAWAVGSGQNYNWEPDHDNGFPDRNFMPGMALLYDWLRPLLGYSPAGALNYLAAQEPAGVKALFTSGGTAWDASTNPWIDSTVTAAGTYPQADPSGFTTLRAQVLDSMDGWTKEQLVDYYRGSNGGGNYGDLGTYNQTGSNYHWGHYAGLGLVGIAAYYDDPRGQVWYNYWRNQMHLAVDQPFSAHWLGADGNMMDSFNYAGLSWYNIALTLISNYTALGDDLINNSTQPFSWMAGLEYFRHNLEPNMQSMLQRGSVYNYTGAAPSCVNCSGPNFIMQYLADLTNNPLKNQYRWFNQQLMTQFSITPDFVFWDPNGTQTNWSSETTVLGNMANPAGGYGHVYMRSDWTSSAAYLSFRAGPPVFDIGNGHDEYDHAGSIMLQRGSNTLLSHPAAECIRNFPASSAGAGAAMLTNAQNCASQKNATDFSWGGGIYSLMLSPGNPSTTAGVDSVSLTTNAATASGAVLHFASTAGVVPGMVALGTNIPIGSSSEYAAFDTPNSFVLAVTSTTVTIDQSVTSTGVANGATVIFAWGGTPWQSNRWAQFTNSTYIAPGIAEPPVSTGPDTPYTPGMAYSVTPGSATITLTGGQTLSNGEIAEFSWATGGTAPTYYLSGSSGPTASLVRGVQYAVINWNAGAGTFGIVAAPQYGTGIPTTGTALVIASAGTSTQWLVAGTPFASANPARIDLLENTSNYAYARGVGLEALYADSYSSFAEPQYTSVLGYQREVLYLRPKVFLVYDRTRNPHYNQRAVTAASLVDADGNGNPVRVVAANHAFHSGMQVKLTGFANSTVNNNTYTITALDSNQFALNGLTTPISAPLTGGTATGNVWGHQVIPWHTGPKPVEVTTGGQVTAGMRQWYVEMPEVSIASIANTTPVTVTTSAPHYLNTNFSVNIAGATGACASLNGNWMVTVPNTGTATDLTTMTLNNSTAVGACGAAGTIQKFNGAITTIKPATPPAILRDLMYGVGQIVGGGIVYELQIHDNRDCTTNATWCQTAGAPVEDSQNWLTALDASLSASDTATLTPLTATHADMVQVGTDTVAGFQNSQIGSGNCSNNTCTPPAPVLPITYTFTQGGATVSHYLAGLTPSTTYYVTVSGGDVTVAATGSSGAVTSSANGVLAFSGSGQTASSTFNGVFKGSWQ